jgi:hypothetical protein
MERKFYTTLKYGALAIVFAAVAGCENSYVMQLKDGLGWTEAKMLRDGWLKSNPVDQPEIYCYRTLADTDCFPMQKPEHEDRRNRSFYEGKI